MTSPTQEHLLGYLLGALEPVENELLEREIATNPRLAQQLEGIARCVQPLECCRHQDAPRAGLASRTCKYVFAEVAHPVAPARHGAAAAMHAEYGASEASSRWSLADFVVAAGIFIAAGMLFFPAIANSRYQAHLAQCQNNLRQFGHAMAESAQLDPRQEFPSIPKYGALSFVGWPAVSLHDRGYLTSPGVMVCPSSPLAEKRGNWSIASAEAIKRARGEERLRLQREASGSTAISLGYEDGDRYTMGRNLSRDNRVLAADAPTGFAPQLVSQHHDGKGQNAVFESERTAYVLGCGENDCGDEMFLNRNGVVRPGIDALDNVVAPPGTRPYPELISPASNSYNQN